MEQTSDWPKAHSGSLDRSGGISWPKALLLSGIICDEKLYFSSVMFYVELSRNVTKLISCFGRIIMSISWVGKKANPCYLLSLVNWEKLKTAKWEDIVVYFLVQQLLSHCLGYYLFPMHQFSFLALSPTHEKEQKGKELKLCVNIVQITRVTVPMYKGILIQCYFSTFWSGFASCI